jgi:hypothetical protein
MKRDVDIIRQLMFDIERQGAECPLDVLRNGASPETDERLRYHVRLLIDAGLAQQAEHGSQMCVRLTSAGHELLDLCRSEPRWREAKWIVQEQTGGLSLTVLRAVLTKWAIEGISRNERRRRWRRAYRPHYDRVYYHDDPAYRVESYRYERGPEFEEEPIRLVRPRRDYREPADGIDRWDHARTGQEDTLADEPLGVSLPVHMI